MWAQAKTRGAYQKWSEYRNMQGVAGWQVAISDTVWNRRLNALVQIVAAQLTALETLPPQHFAQFRGYLGSSSGSQSFALISL